MESLELTPGEGIPAAWLQPGAPPLVLDLGCHRGQFLVALALEHPEWNIAGVERLSERVACCRQKIQRLGLSNAAAVRAAIEPFVSMLPPASVAQAHILFPDPWPKRRHQRRRLLQRPFAAQLAAALRQGGMLRIMTDDAAYAAQIRQVLLSLDCWEEAPEPVFPRTAFEEKFLRQGKQPERMFYLKR